MEIGDLPDQGESEPCASVFPAAGLIHPEEGMEDALLIFFRDAAAGVRNTDQELFRLLRLYLTAFSVRLKSSR